jgi:hypothetical protein
MVGGEVARHKERFAHIGLGDLCDDRGAQSVAHHRQIADIVLVELNFELLVERPSVEAGDLAIDLVHQRRRHAVVDDRIEADLGQRVTQLGRGTVERPGLSREIGSEIDDRDHVSVGHDFSRHPLLRPFSTPRIAPLDASSNGKSAATARDQSRPDQVAPLGDGDLGPLSRPANRRSSSAAGTALHASLPSYSLISPAKGC